MGQCTAKRSNGTRCRMSAIRGGNVCRVHGGSAPQVRAAAEARLRAMVDPALGVLEYAMRRRSKLPREAITAARDVLDRAGFKPTDKHELSGPGGGAIEGKITVEFVAPNVKP